MKQLDLILKDKNAIKWTQRNIGGFEAAECATDSIRAAIRRIDAAPEGRTVTGGNVDRTPPNLAAIWPKKETLPHKLYLSPNAVAVVRALAPVSVALRSSKKVPASFRAEFEAEEGTKYARLHLSWHSGRGSMALFETTMEGPPIAFNLAFLAEALYDGGSTVHYDNASRPALIDHETAPVSYPISILMPVTK